MHPFGAAKCTPSEQRTASRVASQPTRTPPVARCGPSTPLIPAPARTARQSRPEAGAGGDGRQEALRTRTPARSARHLRESQIRFWMKDTSAADSGALGATRPSPEPCRDSRERPSRGPLIRVFGAQDHEKIQKTRMSGDRSSASLARRTMKRYRRLGWAGTAHPSLWRALGASIGARPQRISAQPRRGRAGDADTADSEMLLIPGPSASPPSRARWLGPGKKSSDGVRRSDAQKSSLSRAGGRGGLRENRIESGSSEIARFGILIC